MAEIRAHAGTQFCPIVVGVLESLFRAGHPALAPERDDSAHARAV